MARSTDEEQHLQEQENMERAIEFIGVIQQVATTIIANHPLVDDVHLATEICGRKFIVRIKLSTDEDQKALDDAYANAQLLNETQKPPVNTDAH